MTIETEWRTLSWIAPTTNLLHKVATVKRSNAFLACLLSGVALFLASRSVSASDPAAAPAAAATPSPTTASPQTRVVADQAQLRRWLESMVWHHGYTRDEILLVTGLAPESLDEALKRFDIAPHNKPLPEVDPPIFVLPYPGGRHPRIGFLDGAVEPQRETKLSVFAPWDRTSYLVLDAPEALWSNLGLTYLAHTHIDTIWSKRGITLPKLEWQSLDDGGYFMRRELPNKIAFTVHATPHRDHLAVRMSLTNGTAERLTDLRVQMCGMLRNLKGFESQTNDNKIFRGSLAACRDEKGDRWVIMGFEPNHRTWGNPPCPCLHSDPRIPDCPPGETRHVDGWLSFHQGRDIESELTRIEAIWKPTTWRTVTGQVVAANDDRPLAARVYVQSSTGRWHFAQPASPAGQSIRYEKQNWNNARSQEYHASVSAHPFELQLPPGEYTVTVERGKEFFPWQQTITVGDAPLHLKIPLRRWINMADRGWYSGDAHVHRPIRQLSVPMLADDVNVALPMVYWTTRDKLTAARGDRTDRDDAALPSRLVAVDAEHVIWPKNTEWEIFSVNGAPHTLGALFALNHKTPFDVGIPPVRSVIEQTDREQALLDMDKHDWPFALVLPPLLGKRLTFELANNHMWRTEFGFTKWSTPAPDWMPLRDATGGDERDWMEFTHRTYWTLLNCGLRLQPTAGTAAGVHPVPIGYGRVYVQVPDGFDYHRWIEGLRNGRSFVTTGPMLFVARDKNQVHIEVHADGPIDSIEWIVNGRAEAVREAVSQPQPDGAVKVALRREFQSAETSWVAVRVWQKSPEGRWRFAHSAPLWYDVPDRPIRPSASEQAFLIRRMERELERSRAVLAAPAVAEYEQALEHYRALRVGD